MKKIFTLGIKSLIAFGIALTSYGQTLYVDNMTGTFTGSRFNNSPANASYQVTGGGVYSLAGTDVLTISGTYSAPWSHRVFMGFNGSLFGNPAPINIADFPTVRATITNPNAFTLRVRIYAMDNAASSWVIASGSHPDGFDRDIPAGQTSTFTINVSTATGSLTTIAGLGIMLFDNGDGSFWDNTFSGSALLRGLTVGGVNAPATIVGQSFLDEIDGTYSNLTFPDSGGFFGV